MSGPGLTPCRPSLPQPLCEHCTRRTLPTERLWRNGTVIFLTVIDPTAILPKGRRCVLVEVAP